jgi:hypothetical protein
MASQMGRLEIHDNKAQSSSTLYPLPKRLPAGLTRKLDDLARMNLLLIRFEDGSQSSRVFQDRLELLMECKTVLIADQMASKALPTSAADTTNSGEL